MNSIWTLQYWKSTAELVLRGAAIGAGSAMVGAPLNAWHLDWSAISGFALSGAVLSLVASLSSSQVGAKGSPLVTKNVP
jgi:Putative lactococcus lactis phage r1t holin